MPIVDIFDKQPVISKGALDVIYPYSGNTDFVKNDTPQNHSPNFGLQLLWSSIALDQYGPQFRPLVQSP